MLLRLLRALLNCLQIALNFLGPDRIAHVVKHVAEKAEQHTKVCEIAVLRKVLDTFPQNPLRTLKIVPLDQLVRHRCDAENVAGPASGPFPKNFLRADRIALVLEQVAESVEQLTKICEIAILRKILDFIP